MNKIDKMVLNPILSILSILFSNLNHDCMLCRAEGEWCPSLGSQYINAAAEINAVFADLHERRIARRVVLVPES